MTEIKRTSQNKPLQRQGESVSPLSRYSNSPSYGVRTEEVISQTLADVIQNVIVGAVKSLEGIADVGQTIVGGIGGIFDSGFRDQIQKNVAYDWTMETFGNDWENQLRNSALNNNKVGGFVENVAQGVGGMLPAVAVTLATGGLGAPAAVGQALSLGTMATGAAGQSTEEAYKEGAGYLQGALYGAASGAIEAATEKMFGGVSSAIYGKGIMDGAVKSVGRSVGESALKQTAKRIGKEALEEGVEEVVSELASPLAKTIYKGGDALKEYGNPEYWKGVAEAGLAGSATALAYAGTVGYGMSKIRRGGKPLNYVGKEANIAEAVESIETEKERILKMADNSKISEKALKTTQENIKAYYADIQANLTSMSEKARSQAISDMSLEKAFNQDGTMTEDFSKQLDYDGGISEGTEAPKAKYHSLNMSAEDVDKAISNNDAKAMTDSFTEEEEISYREFKKAFGKLRRASGNNLKYVVVDSMKDGNAYFDPETNAIVIGRDQMGKMNENISDAWKQSIVHEAFHFSQGTKSASKVISKLLDSDDIANEIFNDMAVRGYDTAIVKKYLSGEDMTAEETAKFNEFRDEFEAVLMEHALGNDAFISKLVRDDITTAQRMLNGINDAKEVFTKDKKIRKAERMYLKAVEEAGMTYEGRKILAKKEEDDEEKNEQTTKTKQGIRESRKTIDEDYMKAVESGDMKTAQKMVGEAAKEAGYNTPNLFHGTRFFGFTEFDLTRGEGLIFATPNKEVAGTYSPQNKKVRGISEKYVELTEDEKDNLESAMNQEAIDAAYQMSGILGIRGFVSQEELLYAAEVTAKGMQWWDIDDDDYKDIDEIINDCLDAYYDGMVDKDENPDRDDWLYSAEADDLHDKFYGYYAPILEMAKQLYGEDFPDSGLYSLYGKANNPFEMDAKESWWNQLRDDRLPTKTAYKTRDVALWAQKNGYDSVIIHNVKDTGNGRPILGDIYIFFNESQVKSADPVTYDNNGEIIPLSERFDTSNKDIRYSLKRVSPVQPTDGWKRSLTFDEVKEKYPNLWDVSADESDTKNPTSVKVTVSSYDKIYDFLKQEGFKGKILDASSGLGYGTELGADKYGFDVEDVEPFPGDRHEPTYRDYEKIKGKYDVIISNAVLNVLPQDIRDSLVKRMKELLAPGGRIFVNVRGDDVLNASSKDIIDKDNLEVYISNTGSYQKGFKKPELVAYLQDALGNGYDVKPTSFFGKTSAIVTNKGVRYSRKAPDIEGRRIQKTAKYSAERVFTLTEARRVLDNVLSTAVAETLDDMDYSFSSSKASKEDVAKVFWKNLNTATDEEVQKKVALDMADYAIRNLTAEAVYTDEETEGRSNAIPRLDAYSTLFGVIDRKGTVLKKNIKALLETMPLDQVKDYLADAGITIEAETEADTVDEIWKKYKADVDTLSNHIRQTLDSLGEETVAKMKQEIADSIVEQYRKNGKLSTARSMIDYAFDVARKWHDRLVEANRLNKVEDQWERQMRSKTAKGNVQYFVDRELASSKDDPTLSEQLTTFKDAVDAIYSEVNTKTKLHSRARSLEIIRSSAARILAWFDNTNNPVVQYLKDAGDYDSVRDLISSVANLGNLDADSLKMALNMVKVITHIAEFANTVYVDNKRFDITEQAYKYNQIADTTMSVPSKFRNWLLNTWYKYTGRFSDPSSLFLAADGYDSDGFFSTMYRSFRDASVKAVETLNELLSPMEDYFKEHKQWYKGLSGRTATINGTEVPMEIAMSFYCTLHRPHAWEGALTAGFAYTDTKGVRHEVKPFMSVGEYREMLKADKENGTTEVADKVNEIMSDISSQMTETDMGYIDLVWDMMDKARALKEKTDITRMGVSNVEQGMYYPIGRDNQNLKIEDDFGEEMQNIRNYSFNKNTVRGANGRLYIKPVTRVVNLHARGMANYANLTMPIENYYKVMNYKVSGTSRSPDRIKDKVQKIWTEALPYMQKYIQDMQGIGTNADTFLSFMRGNFAAAQLGLNPKVLLTQLSSLFAASNILKYKYYTRGFGVGARTKASVLDEHSAVAKMRYEENEAVLAQANLERKAMHTKKGQVREGIRTISEKTTSLIGMMDRNVVRLLYGVCQVQVEAEQGLKIGTEENLKASADLLNRVIFETQQNAYSTERSAAMRSNNELLKTLTMFTADQVKIVGRLIDSVGTVLHLKAEMKAHPGRPGLEERLKQANKQLARSAAALVEVAAFIAMIAALFRKLFRKEEENEAETIAVDFAGNLLGGLPILSDAYDYFTNGFEVSSPQYDMINNTFKAFTDTIGLMDKAANGTLTDNDIAKAVRSTVFSTSQLVGLPVRNAYNVATGITRLVSPEAGLKVDSLFNSQLLAKEFNDAMEKGDGEKAEMIARLIAKERVEGLTEQTEKEYGRLMAEDYNILPPSVGDTVTYDDTEYTLSAVQRKAFKAIQAQADDAVSRMIQTKEYKNADDAIKAKAIRWMNQVYYNLAIEDLTGVSIEDKTVLFSRAVDVSKLAIILAQASGIKADTDKEGKQIVGTRKAKIVSLLERQMLKAAQKYMILGYLGYKNTTGEQAVRTYIQSLKLTRAQKEKLFSYCGYGD